MNIVKMNILLWKKYWTEKKAVRIKRHLTKSFYNKVDEAIETCKQHPRKYYVIQADETTWEILGSQELRKMRKFSEARKDETFMHLHEIASVVSPDNLSRLMHERARRKWWFMYAENWYKPVTKAELEMLEKIQKTGDVGEEFDKFILKHK